MTNNVSNIISKLKDIDAKINNINKIEIVNENVENIEVNQPCDINIDNMEDGVNILYSDNTFSKFSEDCKKEDNMRVVVKYQNEVFEISRYIKESTAIHFDKNTIPVYGASGFVTYNKEKGNMSLYPMFNWDYVSTNKFLSSIREYIIEKDTDEYVPSLPIMILISFYIHEINKALKFIGKEEILIVDKESRSKSYWTITPSNSGGMCDFNILLSKWCNGTPFNAKNCTVAIKPIHFDYSLRIN